MTKIRITKMFEFEMAHALRGYDGLCSHIHGHSYKLFVTLIGEPINDVNSPKYGMVMDFVQLKQIVKKQIIEPFDHSLLLNSIEAKDIPEAGEWLFEKTLFKDFQPTCENLIIEFAKIILTSLPATVKLHSLKLYETSNSYSEWFADDN